MMRLTIVNVAYASCVTTRSITIMTTMGGSSAITLSTNEPTQMSRRVRFSRNTMRASQPRLNGASSSVPPRIVRISIVSPDQTCERRSSSIATGGSSAPPRGSRSHTTLRAASACTRTPALPSFSNRTAGDEPSSRSRLRHFSRTARAHSPALRTHSTRAAGDGGSPSGNRRSSRSNSMPWKRAASAIAFSRIDVGSVSDVCVVPLTACRPVVCVEPPIESTVNAPSEDGHTSIPNRWRSLNIC